MKSGEDQNFSTCGLGPMEDFPRDRHAQTYTSQYFNIQVAAILAAVTTSDFLLDFWDNSPNFSFFPLQLQVL